MKDFIEYLIIIIRYLLPTIIIMGLVIGATMLMDGFLYGDPMCAFKQCVEVKERYE